VPGIRPVAPPIGQQFGLSQRQLPGGMPAAGGAGTVTLRALRRFVRPGGRLVLVGSVSVPGSRKVRIMLRRRGGWARVRAVRQASNGRFRTGLRLRRLAKPSTGRAPLALRGLRVPRQARRLVLRAQVPGVGRSSAVRVRLRR